MAEKAQTYRIDLDDDERWNSSVQQACQSNGHLFVSQGAKFDASELVTDVERLPEDAVTYFASPAALAADVESTEPFWHAAFPLTKRLAVVAIPGDLAATLHPPRSTSDLLIQLTSNERSIRIVETESLNFDCVHGTLPLADTGEAVDAAVSDYLRQNHANIPDLTLAGLLLANGEDDASHRVSQAFEGQSDFDYWHGLMHRREPDYGNAGYWFRRVGDHPAFDELPAEVARLCEASGDVKMPVAASAPWSAFEVIDFFRKAADQPGSERDQQARLIQQAEIRNLLRYVSQL